MAHRTLVCAVLLLAFVTTAWSCTCYLQEMVDVLCEVKHQAWNVTVIEVINYNDTQQDEYAATTFIADVNRLDFSSTQRLNITTAPLSSLCGLSLTVGTTYVAPVLDMSGEIHLSICNTFSTVDADNILNECSPMNHMP